MSTVDMHNARAAWRGASDEDVIQALTSPGEYPQRVLLVVQEEARRRHLTVPPAADSQREHFDAVLCANCMTANPLRTDFCITCAMPLGMLVNYDPLKMIYAQGWAYHKIVTGPTRPIHLLGMLLIFGPSVLLTVVPPVFALYWSIGPRFNLPTLSGLVMGTFLLVLYCAILYRTIRGFIRYSRYRRMLCGVCGYTLQGLTVPRCPECATPFDPHLLDEQSVIPAARSV